MPLIAAFVLAGVALLSALGDGTGVRLLAAAEASPASQPATRPADITLPDVQGVACKPLVVPAGGKGVVLFFLAHDCPISNSYAPEIARIVTAYGGAGQFSFVAVHPFAELEPAEARKHAAEYGLKLPVFIDARRTLTRYASAKVTPEAAVVLPDGKVCYVGRIDDKWADFGRSRLEPTVRDLREALDAILAGKPVPAPRGESVGCPIE